MKPEEAAFLEADFNWVTTLQNVWRDSPSHVDSLQHAAVDRIMSAFRPLLTAEHRKEIGQVVNGPAGSGKTHLISTLRRRVWAEGGWFVLIDIVGITDFWRTAAFGFIRSLRQAMPDGRSQYQAVFEAALLRIPQETRREVINSGEDLGSGAIATVNLFVRILQRCFPLDGMQHSNVIRALLLQGDPDAAEIAYSWLQGLELDPTDRRALGLTAASPSPDALVSGICWLMSLGGPIMIAIDQIDAIVTAGNIIADKAAEVDDETEARARAIIQVLAGGLMDLYDQTDRAMTVITCLGETWDVLRQRALQPALHRFVPTPLRLNSMSSDRDAVSELIAQRLAPAFLRHQVTPIPSTWPFMASAIDTLEGLWPRAILMQCETYRQRHLGTGHVPACTGFDDSEPRSPPAEDLAAVFQRYRSEAMIGGLKADLDDGRALGSCLRDTLQLYAQEFIFEKDIDVTLAAPTSDARPALHARLTFDFHDQNGLQKHYCFRVISQAVAQAVLPRLRAAMTDSGIDRKLPFRHLFIIRNDAIPGGRVMGQLHDRLVADGGVVVPISEDDLRTFIALRDMRDANIDGFNSWLKRAKPLFETAFFKAVGLCPPPISPTQAPRQIELLRPLSPRDTDLDVRTLSNLASDTAKDVAGDVAPSAETKIPLTRPPGSPTAVDDPATIPLGPRVQGGGHGPMAGLPIPLLTRHTAIFAGSGSGKTVLLRRIVEEAALAGIPAIVLDTNNDLARLGEAWPAQPDAFSAADAEKAARYARDVEVAVWTPGVAAGRPLTLAVLPDFSQLADGEERAQAVDMAWATLAPLVGATGQSKVPKEGLLKEALAAFAREGRTGIVAFIDFLADLPPDVSRQTKASKYAVEMSDQLLGKIAVNPLLSAKGQPLDPEALFTAQRAGATRISVINFAGLEAEASRQDFVNQLQMALFTFIKRKPSETPRLYVCDEAQNFAPSSISTASKASAIALARQGRKFGLGMIFATQAPKGIDTNIVSNCVTHFYGRMSSPALIDATEDMMASRGKAAKDLGALTRGTFYFATEGTVPTKIETPLCLTYHPQNPATPEEVVALAKR